ncbi:MULTISPECIES: hypothetical protein [unclassified Pseudomonas]|uniref:hypothetical protein n=1 Tax=unclassified Pseudomonas TaxID=196821 RepID=UPI0011A59BBE|nr:MULTISPECIES: hypothetical protein [unclassified Pseudomonas]
MNKPAQRKTTRLAAGKKTSITIRDKDGRVTAFLSNADAVVERHATQSLAGRILGHGIPKGRSVRALHLSDVERELAELKRVVAALAVRSVAHEEKALDFDVEGMTRLDADTAYQLLDNPPEPTEALRNLLTLR